MSTRLPGSKTPHSVPDLNGAHILIADDRPDELRLLMEILRTASCRISIAFDGLQLYHRAQAIAPDLIVTDIRMPRMDGFAACRLLAATQSTRTIPIVILTAVNEVEHRIEGLKTGAIDYIAKPFEPLEVIMRIRNHLRRARDALTVLSPPELPDVPDAALVRAASEILMRNLRDPPGLEDLARLVGTHEKRLSRVFRRNLGQSVFEYLRDTRLCAATQFLARTSMSIDSIAQEIGFATAGNFATAFRGRFGITPSEWRKQHRRDGDGQSGAEVLQTANRSSPERQSTRDR